MGAESSHFEPPLDWIRLGQTLTEHAPLPMATVEGPGHLVRYANPAFCRLVEQPLAHFVGKAFAGLLPAADESLTVLDRVFRTGKPENFAAQSSSLPHPFFWSYAMWPVMAAGERPVGVTVQVTETARFHEQVVAVNEALLLSSIQQHEITAAAEGVNARLKAEISAHETTTRELAEKARLLDLTHDAIIVRDYDDRISLWNKGAEKVYGWSCEEVIGLDLHTLLQTEFPKPKEEIIAQLHQEGGFEGEVVQVGRDGRRIPSLCRWVLDRATDSILTSYTDITERHRLEEALKARAKELARADRSKDEFLAMLAHELRNPLAPMRNAAAILRTADADVEGCEQAQGILARQIENMTRMIDDLLDVSRITEGKIELQRQVVSLETICHAAANLARPGILARGQGFAMSLPPGPPIYLLADATRLEQVFGNLLGNASKYSDPGCHLTFRAERAEAHGTEPPEIIVRVRDDGIGIAPELLPHIFDLFVQATRASDRAHGGLGIGLTIVQRLVKLHGGSVEAHSEGIGHGSEFVVRLPVLPGPVPVTPPGGPAPGPRHAAADAHRGRQRGFRAQHGHPPDVARPRDPHRLHRPRRRRRRRRRGIFARSGVARHRTPRHGRLRGRPPPARDAGLAGVFLVAMTGYDSDADRAQARAAGFDEYLVKPVDLDLLRGWLRGRE